MYDKFRQIIQEKGITVYRVSKGADVPYSTLSDWKSGRSKPKLDKLVKIADYLGVELGDLI